MIVKIEKRTENKEMRKNKISNKILTIPKLCEVKNRFVNTMFFYVVLLFSLISYSQVTIKSDTTKIRIGEQFDYQIEVDAINGVEFYKLRLDSLQKIEVIKSHDIDTLKEKLIKKYTLTSFDSGRYQLPKQLVKIFSKPVFTDSLIIDVSTVAVDTIKQPLFPIKAIQHQKLDLKDYAKNYWYLLPILIVLAFIVWYFFIRKKETEEERIAKIPPFEMAVQQLESLDKKLLWQNNKTKEYYSELTDIIRTYIEKELKVQALESTTNELVKSIKKFNNIQKLDISKKTILKLKDLLQEADLVKFAKSKPFANEIEMHRKYADVILEGLKPLDLVELPNNPDLEVDHVEETINDTNTVSTTVNDNQEIIPTTVQEQVTKTTKISKKKKRNIIIISITVIFLILGIYLGKTVYNKVMGKIGNYIDTSSTKELYNAKWKTQSFGKNTLTIKTPVELKVEKVPELPEEVKQLIDFIELYNYTSLINNLQIVVSSSKYLNAVPLNLDGATNGVINTLKTQPTITDFIYEIEEYNDFGLTGNKITGTFNERGVSKEFTLFVFVKENSLWNVMFSNKQNDEFGKKIIDKIINSLKIEDAN